MTLNENIEEIVKDWKAGTDFYSANELRASLHRIAKAAREEGRKEVLDYIREAKDAGHRKVIEDTLKVFNDEV